MTLSSEYLTKTQTNAPILFYGGKSTKRTAIELPESQCLIQPNISLARLTSYHVGGPAEWYVAPKTREALYESFQWAEKHSLPINLLGAGSNLLVSDEGLPGLTVSTRYIRNREFNNDLGQVTVGAGEPIARLAWLAAKQGWQGLEWGVGIPGSIGGSVVMNAGAHQSCVADRLVNAVILNPNGSIETLTPEDLNYSYRTSCLQGKNRLVLEATFQLKPGASREEVMAQTNKNLKQRKNSQPYHLPSCGSVFRNPKPHAAGWLIEQLGLKGYQIGGAQIAHRHANFILNCGNAKAQDIFNLIQYAQEQVERNWSLKLHPEVRVLGEFSG